MLTAGTKTVAEVGEKRVNSKDTAKAESTKSSNFRSRKRLGCRLHGWIVTDYPPIWLRDRY